MTAAGRCSPPADPCKTDGVSPLPRPPGILKARTEYFCTGFFHRVSFAFRACHNSTDLNFRI